jgi:MGT family glycosyltransferase
VGRRVDGAHAARAAAARLGAAAPRALFARHGLGHVEFRTCEALSPWLNTVFATRALVGDVVLPPATHLVGPSVPRAPRGDEPDFPWHELDGRPLAIVSFGSQISHQPELFPRLAAAAAAAGAQVVVSAGELADDEAFRRALPPGAIARAYLPQRALLARAALLVTHGGANSVMEALTAGVPLLLCPVCNDQPVQAHFVGRAGAGLALDPLAADDATLRAAIARLVEPAGPARRAAAAIAADYAQHDGADTAARLVLELAAARGGRR